MKIVINTGKHTFEYDDSSMNPKDGALLYKEIINVIFDRIERLGFGIPEETARKFKD